MKPSGYIDAVDQALQKEANARIASEQKAYMRGQYDYYGLKAPLRRKILRPFLAKEMLPPKSQLNGLVKKLWAKPQRDFQYFSQELAFKYLGQLEEKDIALYEFMVTHKSWWDTVDFIASNLMGAYFKKYPDKRKALVKKWLASGNIWLQRSALLFQLKYKHQLDTALLSSTINALLGSQEFFINKAIGWVLREYSKTDPLWVLGFVKETGLNTLSKREAIRLIN